MLHTCVMCILMCKKLICCGRFAKFSVCCELSIKVCSGVCKTVCSGVCIMLHTCVMCILMCKKFICYVGLQNTVLVASCA